MTQACTSKKLPHTRNWLAIRVHARAERDASTGRTVHESEPDGAVVGCLHDLRTELRSSAAGEGDLNNIAAGEERRIVPNKRAGPLLEAWVIERDGGGEDRLESLLDECPAFLTDLGVELLRIIVDHAAKNQCDQKRSNM